MTGEVQVSLQFFMRRCTGSTDQKTVALLVETSRAYGRGICRGVARFAEQNPDWLILYQERNLKESIPEPLMREVGGGSITHMASVTGHNGHPGITVYGATKGALIALARGQAIELAKDKPSSSFW